MADAELKARVVAGKSKHDVVTIRCTRIQAEVIQTACELYARLGMGQLQKLRPLVDGIAKRSAMANVHDPAGLAARTAMLTALEATVNACCNPMTTIGPFAKGLEGQGDDVDLAYATSKVLDVELRATVPPDMYDDVRRELAAIIPSTFPKLTCVITPLAAPSP